MTITDTRPEQHWVWKVNILRWLDGDTVEVIIDRGFKDSSMRRLRLLGIQAPELKEPTKEAALKSLTRAHELAPVGTNTVMSSHVGTTVGQIDSFGRYLAVLWPSLPSETRSINQILLEEGLAVEYER